MRAILGPNDSIDFLLRVYFPSPFVYMAIAYMEVGFAHRSDSILWTCHTTNTAGILVFVQVPINIT